MNGRRHQRDHQLHRTRACLVAGCSCKDARIVSTRRASYFASVAKARGETADRMIEAEPTWVLPVWSGP